VVVLADSGPSWKQLAIGLLLLVFAFYVVPRVVVPAVARWQSRRRGGATANLPPRWTAPINAAIVAVFVIVISWNSDLGRPALAALLVATLGVIGGLWWTARRGG
jgi:hypothetical protein